MNERYVSTQAVNNAVEHRKHTLIYFYSGDEDINIHFKAISSLEWLQDDFLFVSVRNPSQTLMKDYFINKLPAIRGALAPLREGEEIDIEQVKQFQYGGPLDFDEILFNLLKLTGKQDEYKRKQERYVALRRDGKNPRYEEIKPKKKKNKSKTRAKKDDL